jgi:hypothetical protein
MKGISIHVENGKITGQAPAGLPDGDFELALVEPEDEMTDEEFERLEAALARGLDDVRQGRTRPASDFAAELLRGR